MSKRPIAVVGGSAYADIDVLACASAYQQFLCLLGNNAQAIITGPWNQTITHSIKQWPIQVQNQLSLENCVFVLVDISDPKHLEKFVNQEDVIEVFDHHHGYEEYWQNRLGKNAHIEKIGACATLIWEKFKAEKVETQINVINANLLYTAIFANTLDFKSAVTEKRDREAADEIYSYTNLPSDWKKIYYTEVEKGFKKDLIKSILTDTKQIQIFGLNFFFGQIEVWDFSCLDLKKITALEGVWVINIVCIKDGYCYLYSNSSLLYEYLKIITKASFENNMLKTSRLWLRKELLNQLMIIEDISFETRSVCIKGTS